MKAVIFDIDGTLLDTETIYVKAWKLAAKEFGYTLSDDLMKKTRAVNVKTAAKIMESEVGNGFSYDTVRVKRLEIAEKIIEQESPILKTGAMEILDFLRKHQIPYAAATSSRSFETEKHLKLSGISHLFPIRVTADMITHGKPAPDIFLKAAELLGVEPADCLVVEDSGAGLEAALAAGMQAIWIPDMASATEDIRCQCIYECKNLLELIPFLEGQK